MEKFIFKLCSVCLLDLDNGRAEPSCGDGLLQKTPLNIYKLIGNERMVREVLCYTATAVYLLRKKMLKVSTNEKRGGLNESGSIR